MTYTYNPSGDPISFIEKIRFTSYKITKLSLMYSLNFTSYEASKVDRFFDMHLRSVILPYRFGMLLHLDASECSSEAISSCYFEARLYSCPQPETSNSPNFFIRSVSPSFRDLQGKLLKVIWFQGFCLQAPRRGLPAPFQPPR